MTSESPTIEPSIDDPIDADEHQAYRNFLTGEYRKLRVQKYPDVLFHYTTGQNLISIVTTSEFWCTQISCMNDSVELSHGLSLLRSALEQRQPSIANDTVLLEFNKRILTRLNEQSATRTHLYVACFTDKDDDLSQWRAYGGDGGYALGMSTNALIEAVGTTPGITLAPAIYAESEKINFLNNVIPQIEVFFRSGLDKRPAAQREHWSVFFIESWFINLCNIICRFKDSRFSSENEWRLVLNTYARGRPKISKRFSQIGSMFRRHIVLPLGENLLLPIAQIRIGPTQFPDQCRLGVKEMLFNRGYRLTPQDVDNSAIPLRRLN